MDVSRKVDIDRILVKFLGEIAHWNQTTAAKLLGIDRRRFNDYYNHRRETPDEVLVKIKDILRARGIYLENGNSEKFVSTTQKLSHSERAKQALVHELWGKKRSGRQSNKNLLIRQNFDELNQKKLRTDEMLAKQYEFRNRGTLRHAIYAVENGCPGVLRLMDREDISISMAFQLAHLPDEVQESLVVQGADAIKHYFASKHEKSKEEAMTKAFKLLHHHPEFIQLNQEAQASVKIIIQDILHSLK